MKSILAKAMRVDVSRKKERKKEKERKRERTKETRYLILKSHWNFNFVSISLTINCRQVDSS